MDSTRPQPNSSVHEPGSDNRAFSQAWNKISDEGAELAYGRLSVAPASFFETVWLSSYRAVGEDIANNPEPYVIDGKARLSRAIFRA